MKVSKEELPDKSSDSNTLDRDSFQLGLKSVYCFLNQVSGYSQMEQSETSGY